MSQEMQISDEFHRKAVMVCIDELLKRKTDLVCLQFCQIMSVILTLPQFHSKPNKMFVYQT